MSELKPIWPDDYLISGIEPFHVEDAGIIYCADCRDILPHLPKVDLLLTDPPYGKGNFVQISGNVRGEEVSWNHSKPLPSTFDMINRIAKDKIIFGANYFNSFGILGGAIVWVKNQPMPDFSKADIASVSFNAKVEVYNRTWTNFVNTKQSKHPCERPIDLYRWCIEYAPFAHIILDPFLGSGSVVIAAKELGRKFIGIEISEEYCAMAVKRLRQGVFIFE